DAREWKRSAPGTAVTEEHECIFLHQSRGLFNRRRSVSGMGRSSGNQLRTLRDIEDIEKQRDTPVPHDRRAGKAAHLFDIAAERFDDDLLGILDIVDNQSELPGIGLQDNDVQLAAVFTSRIEAK